jgi:hypothetical protein
MTDNMNKSIDNEELDLDQLENVSGGAFNGAAAVNGAAKALGGAIPLGVAKPLMCGATTLGSAKPLTVQRMTNEAGVRSTMNSTPQALTDLLLNSDNMLGDK